MADYIVDRIMDANNSFKVRSNYYQRIAISSGAGDNVYIRLGGIPLTNNNSDKTITLLCATRFTRYLIKIGTNYSDNEGDSNPHAVNVVEISKAESEWCNIQGVHYLKTGTAPNITMQVWFKLYMDGDKSPFEIVDISENFGIPFTLDFLGNDDTVYEDTTLSDYFNNRMPAGRLNHTQFEEIYPSLRIGSSSYNKVYGALSALNSAKLDTADACLNNTFSSTKQYYIGDFVIRNNDVYECIVAHYGTWNSSHFTQRYLAQEIQASPRYNMMGGSTYRLLKPASANSKNGWYEISLQTSMITLSASSWTDTSVTMSNGIFDFFDPSELQYIHIAVTQQTAVLINNDTVENYPVFCRINNEMHEANKFSLSVKAIDSAQEGNRYVRVTFIAYIHQTD